MGDTESNDNDIGGDGLDESNSSPSMTEQVLKSLLTSLNAANAGLALTGSSEVASEVTMEAFELEAARTNRHVTEEASAGARSVGSRLRDLWLGFVDAGFNEEQAMSLTQQAFFTMMMTGTGGDNE